MRVAYIILLLVSLFGNSVIIRIIRTDNSTKTTTNYLILNQACADLLTSVGSSMLFLTPYSYYLGNLWFGGSLGQVTCKLFMACINLPPFFSVWILAVIAVNRFYAVSRPLGISPISEHKKKIIALIWVWSAASSTDILLNNLVIKVEEYYYCNFLNTEIIFQFVLTTLNFVLPLVIIVVLYSIVCYKLWSREVPGEGTNQNQAQAEALQTAQKVTRMMVVVVVLFLLCWFPYAVSFSLQVWGYFQLSSNLNLFFAWLTVLYSGINPYIYFTFSQQFRHAFTCFLRNCFRKTKIGIFFSFSIPKRGIRFGTRMNYVVSSESSRNM